MLKLLNLFRKERIWDFDGGIHPPEMKTQSSRVPMRHIPLPEQFIIPLKQHLGPEGELCVNVGDRVLRGQPLTRGTGRMLPVHAPTSGTVHAIRPHMTAHPSALPELSIIIIPDGEDRWCDRQCFPDYQQHSIDTLLAHLHQAGIAGLGGAGFPTSAKLKGGLRGIATLIINAAECEPYITADDRLMQEYADEIVQGIEILMHLLSPERTLIGIEDNKPEAIQALRHALADRADIRLRVVPTKYPSGGAKQLTKILTGKEVPFDKHSASIGVLMQNVGTAYAIKRAVIDGEALTERVVTLTGEALRQPGNVWARLGTPVRHLLKQAGFHAENKTPMVVMGGPLMGFTLPALDVPIVKISNCILAPSVSEMQVPEQEQSCIRCSKCADACPAGLLPQQLYWFSRGQEHEKARAHHLFDCIECGACAYVCPSNIPLVQYYRQEKAEIRAIDLEASRAHQAKARFDAKQLRLEREKAARERRHQQAAATVSTTDKQAVQAALERVRSKNTLTEALAPIAIHPDHTPDNSAVIAAREARKTQAREMQRIQAEAEQAQPVATAPEDPRQAAVAAAIARVKAKKAAQQAPDAISAAAVAAPEPEAVPEPDLSDPRKAAVAAAIARVKAKKAAQQAPDATTAAVVTAPEPEAVPEPDLSDPRKAAVAAAIARVKARKAEQALIHTHEE
ncbi:electron transport complex subunit RsxC [Candidatus Symbiopectobacterium sp. NZEC151]|uniref:electron transport complex subunit RsxC n=1 Tax=Candidatus Symbiopectobacterium sp. NZEC151 TaxID=2820470 RepID=UPI00222649EE|nr:electron transport complex subunit RsxC [Candidatus Symbiopectobacterium sp. NZEC151]MCW2473834.1 electron transport complex subunit RsxC [Candidatus Symbiopectobacterium sp. NZEC151]